MAKPERERRREEMDASGRGGLDYAPSVSRIAYLNRNAMGKNVTQFRPEKGSYKLIFLPWKAGKNNTTGNPGETVVNRYFSTHAMIGPNEEAHLCLAQFGEKCAVCELFQRLKREGEKGNKTYWNNVLAPLKSKNRELWLVHDTEDRKNPENVMLWDESVHLFGDAFRSVYKKRSAWENFASHKPGRGCIVEFDAEEKAIGQSSCIDCGHGIVLTPREDKLPGFLIDASYDLCPDDWLIKTPYAKLSKLVEQTGGAADEEEDEEEDRRTAVGRGARKPDEEDEEEDSDSDSDDEDSDLDEDQDSEEDDSDEEIDDTDEEDEDELPPRSRSRSKPKGRK